MRFKGSSAIDDRVHTNRPNS